MAGFYRVITLRAIFHRSLHPYLAPNRILVPNRAPGRLLKRAPFGPPERAGMVFQQPPAINLSFRALIAPQHTEEIRDFGQVIKGPAASVFLDVADEIQVEEVFPWPAAQRARSHLGEVDVAQGKNTQALVERARSVRRGKDNRNLIGFCLNGFFLREQEKPGEILMMVLKVGAQDTCAVYPGCNVAGDRSGALDL